MLPPTSSISFPAAPYRQCVLVPARTTRSRSSLAASDGASTPTSVQGLGEGMTVITFLSDQTGSRAPENLRGSTLGLARANRSRLPVVAPR